MTLRSAQEKFFTASDGAALFYRYWPGEGPNAVVLFHRGHEHSGRLQEVVDGLGLTGYHCFAWDARGLGRSHGIRGYAENFGVFMQDADNFVRHINQTYGIAIENMAVLAQSVGAVIAAAWVHDYAPPIRCLVLAAPAFKVKLYVPLARPSLALMQKFKPVGFVNSYVKAKFLTHDAARIESYNRDPLITRPIAVNILLALYSTAERLVADAGAITTPTQVLVSGADWVVHRAPQQAFYERLGATEKEFHDFPGFYHDLLGEKDRHLPLAKARDFILRAFARPYRAADFSQADRSGYTYDEFQAIARPAPPLKRLYYAIARAGIRAGALMSQGLALGRETGFDSGSTLDYVYENTARGCGPVGRLMDRNYLDAIGWRGIRIRKQNLERLIASAAQRLRLQNTPIHMVDIAAGHGRYMLDVAQQTGAASILLRDYSALNVEQGRKRIAERGLDALARFEQGDAFDQAALAALTPRPTIAVVSGLYELFPDNAPIRASLAGLSEAVPAGGYLVYTNQPWHPQLELIARTLTSHRQHQDWVMRRRTQGEMDQLVAQAGFVKIDQLADEWGIFTVSLARKT